MMHILIYFPANFEIKLKGSNNDFKKQLCSIDLTAFSMFKVTVLIHIICILEPYSE